MKDKGEELRVRQGPTHADVVSGSDSVFVFGLPPHGAFTCIQLWVCACRC